MADTMQRLSFDEGTTFSAVEAAIHLNRYMLARPWCAGKKVLDVACGQGYGAYVMAERWGAAAVHGVDISPEAIESAERHFASDHVVYRCEAAENLAALFKPREFDLIVSIETFEHLQDPAVMLRGLKRVIRPGGTVIVSCPNDHWYYRTPEESNPFHVHKYTFEEFRAIVEAELGPPLYFLLGTPVAGYINLRNGSRMTARAAESNKAMLDAHDRLDALIVPTEERIDWTNCNYFAGIWGREDREGATTATVYACSLEASQPGHRQSQVENLRDEVVSLRDKLFTSRAALQQREREVTALQEQTRKLQSELRLVGLRASAFQAENEFIREEFQELRTRLVQLQQHHDEQARTIEKQEGTIGEQARTIEKQEGTIGEQARTVGEQNALIADWRRRIENLDRVKRLIPGPAKSALKWLLRWK